jgi:hypothetical protein
MHVKNWRLILAVGGCVAVLVLIVLSPLALRYISSVHHFDWTRLSNVGQATGPHLLFYPASH